MARRKHNDGKAKKVEAGAKKGRWNTVCAGKTKKWSHGPRCRNKDDGRWTFQKRCHAC